MPKRRTPQPGQSYQQANPDRLIKIEQDVLAIRGEIKSRWPALEVYLDEYDETWVVTQTNNNEETLLFTTDVLDRTVIERCQRADQAGRRQGDLLDDLDRENAALEREQERIADDKLDDAGERLMHALHKDGFICRPTVFFPEKLLWPQ